MEIRIAVTTPTNKIRTINATEIAEAKSVAMHINAAKMVLVQIWDGKHFVTIQRFPTMTKSGWEACTLGTEENKDKNVKLLKRFLKSSYAK